MNTDDTTPGLDAAEDARRFAAIREVLTSFDWVNGWENGDYRRALEEIERIAFGGQP